jgi:hypothetical protein
MSASINKTTKEKLHASIRGKKAAALINLRQLFIYLNGYDPEQNPAQDTGAKG